VARGVAGGVAPDPAPCPQESRRNDQRQIRGRCYKEWMSPSALDSAVTYVLHVLGKSRAANDVRKRIADFLARHGTEHPPPPILFRGEVGVGKSLLARLIHQVGPCPDGPFVVSNDWAIPEPLHEAALFGIAPGSFTPPRPGLFQRAHRGTLFLDGVGWLPLNLQRKILWVLEKRAVRRVGGTQDEPAVVWIIAATSEDLKPSVREGRFSAELYQQLGQLDLLIPPLRKRRDDILLIAEHCLGRVCDKSRLPPKSLAADARRALLAYPWAGNVRELRAVIERAALQFAKNDIITAAMLALPNWNDPARRPRRTRRSPSPPR
jgi:DNA-binding NtrC family response regulator